MADNQYDVSKKLQRLFAEKQKIRQAAREEVLKREFSPYGHGQFVDDPAVTRYHAMITYRAEHVKPNPRNLTTLCCFVFLPILLVFTSEYNHAKKKERIYRSGQIAYKDRLDRTIL